MSNKMYPEAQVDQRERMNLYKRHEEVLSIPRDYFDEIKMGLSAELAKGYVETRTCLAHHLKIAQDFEELRRIITVKESRLLQIERDKGMVQSKVVILEEVSKDEGKKLFEDYFKEHGCADIEELMLNLRISVQSIVEIIDELKNEGKLVPKGENKA